jgi:T-complex protein 1 subunit delta
MVVKDIEREDIEFISKTIGAIPVANIENLKEDKLGYAGCCLEERLNDDQVIFKI